MATPSLTRHALAGALGPVAVDVRAGDRATPRPAVVVLHGYKGFKDWGMFPPACERLARAGFVAVSLNASGAGVDAEGRFTDARRFAANTYGAERDDLAAVVDALAAGALGVAAPTAIGLLGHSRGGAVAALQAARDPRVRALVTWAAIGRLRRWDDAEAAAWRARGSRDVVNARTGEVLPQSTALLDEVERGALDLDAAVAAIAVPWLLLHGTADEAVPLAEGEALAARARPGVARLEALPGAGHTFGTRHPWAGTTPEFEAALAATTRWFGRHLT